MSTSVANPVADGAILGQKREAFAALVAVGISYREAAQRAGFSRDYGWDLMQDRHVRQRVIDLAQQPAELIRAGIDAELVQLRNRAAGGDLTDADREDIKLRLTLALAHAKVRGLIIDKKQIARASMDFGKISPEDLDARVAGLLDDLDPNARRDSEARIKALDVRRAALSARRTVEVRVESKRD
jgi:hypothetical protein